MRSLRLKISIVFISIFVCTLNSQQKTNFLYIHGSDTNYVPYMYTGSDTLDYSDGGTMTTNVALFSLEDDRIMQDYILSGKLVSNHGESFEDFGIVTTGAIEEIQAKTWIGETQTGLLVNDSPFHFTHKGNFSVRIPYYYNSNVIFTTLGGASIVVYPFEQIMKLYGKNKPQ